MILELDLHFTLIKRSIKLTIVFGFAQFLIEVRARIKLFIDAHGTILGVIYVHQVHVSYYRLLYNARIRVINLSHGRKLCQLISTFRRSDITDKLYTIIAKIAPLITRQPLRWPLATNLAAAATHANLPV